MDHQIFNKIECHPSTVSAIEHLLIASTQLGIDNLKIKSLKWTVKLISEWPTKLHLEWTTRFQSYK